MSTVRLLEASAGAAPPKLLRLASSRVRHKKSPVVPHQNILNLLLRLLVDEFLVEGDQRFGDALADGVDLRHVASTFDADAHVDTGEAVAAEEEDRLVGLVPENFRLDELDRGAVDLDQAAAALAVGHGDGVLLTAEALHGFHGWRRHSEVRGSRFLKSRILVFIDAIRVSVFFGCLAQ